MQRSKERKKKKFTERKDRKDKDKMPNSDDGARSKPGVIQTLGDIFTIRGSCLMCLHC